MTLSAPINTTTVQQICREISDYRLPFRLDHPSLSFRSTLVILTSEKSIVNPLPRINVSYIATGLITDLDLRFIRLSTLSTAISTSYRCDPYLEWPSHAVQEEPRHRQRRTNWTYIIDTDSLHLSSLIAKSDPTPATLHSSPAIYLRTIDQF